MQILVIADDERFYEMQLKLESAAQLNPALQLALTQSPEFNAAFIQQYSSIYDLIFDLSFDSQPERIAVYNQAIMQQKPIVVNAVWHSLSMAIAQYSTLPLHCQLIGMNALPTFINRSLWEISLPDASPERKIFAEQVLANLGIKFHFTDDRVGMVTPRIVTMIINEAYFLWQEQGANKQDIDIAMKLGVNYPQGPFEWAANIGITNVIKTLEAVYNDTHDERYRLCPLLKRQLLALPE
jgi:3-hydroxybutyryl-CoA dehydrogenase